MLKRCLVIGLGGSAEKLVRYLDDYLVRLLRDRGWNGPLPDAWQWLCIDVAEETDVVTEDVPVDITGGRRAGLARNPYEWPSYYDEVTGRDTALPGLVGCLPSRDTELPPPFKGAGQRPQVGHAVGLSELRQVGDAIADAIQRMQTQQANEQLADLARMLQLPESPRGPGNIAILVSSICGGSGAGLVQLVTEQLLGSATGGAEWLRHELSTVLFLPSVFADLTDVEREGVNANALYTVSSILNGYEATGSSPERLAALAQSGGATQSGGRRAAVTNFFVSGGNGHLTFRHQNETIRATARALVRMLVDPQVSNGLDAHLETNRVGATVAADFRIVDPSATSRAASSLGYASVSLGAATIESYTAERIALATFETLLRGHRRFATPGEREDKTVRRVADEHTGWFRSAALLTDAAVLAAIRDTHGADRNGDGALDAHEARRLRERLRHQVQDHVSQATAALGGNGSRRGDGGALRGELEQHIAAVGVDLSKRRDAAREAARARWSTRVDAALRGAVATSVGRFGMPVTLRLLDDARTAIDGLASELELTQQQEQKLAEGRRTLANRALAALGARRGGRAARAAEEAKRDLGQELFLRGEAQDLELAAVLLRQLPAAVLAPMRSAVESARLALAASEQRHDRARVEEWSAGPLPPHLQPAPNELLLEPADGFPSLVDGLLAQTLGAPTPKEGEVAAVEEVVTGIWSSRDGALPERQNLVARTESWTPVENITGAAAYELRLRDADEVLTRTRRWTRERRGALGDRLRLPIARWIAGDPGRPDALASKVEQALRFATPLAHVDATVHRRVHNAPPAPPKLFVSTLPVPPDHRVGRRLRNALHDARVPEGAIAKLFDPSSSTHTIEVSGFTARPMHPIVLDGLWIPIQQDWQGRTDDAMRHQFSTYRRTRALPQFVPLSAERLHAFARGWIAAELLAQLKPPTDRWSDAPLRVWTPSGWRRFPANLLGADPDGAALDELLARVLESMPLALARYACKHVQELEAYMRVLDLGDLSALRRWIADGTIDRALYSRAAAPTPKSALVGTASGNAGQRQRAVRTALVAIGVRWRTRLDGIDLTSESVASVPPWWEIGDVVLDAVADMLAQLGPGAAGAR